MIAGLKKTKASKLWLSMVVVFAVILNVSYVEAKSLKKGEEFKGIVVSSIGSDNVVIRVVSSDEVEIEQGPDILLGKYTVDGERVRIVTTALGTTMVTYYKIIPDGLVEEKRGTIYYSNAAKAGRFKKNGNVTVTDNKTKLMWQQGEGGNMAWESVISYCRGLSLAGYNDWRLPNIEELESITIIDKSYFPNASSNAYYWSSTDASGYGYGPSVYSLSFGSNTRVIASKTNPHYVRCVRGGGDVNAKDNSGQTDLISAVEKGNTSIVKMLLDKGADISARENAGQEKKRNSGTVADNATKLMWQQGEGGNMNWETAIAYCKNLPLAGYSDWRLPNIEELKSIVDVGKTPAINEANFPHTNLFNFYWSSTDWKGGLFNLTVPSLAWAVNFKNGKSDGMKKTDTRDVRCVRGGQ